MEFLRCRIHIKPVKSDITEKKCKLKKTSQNMGLNFYENFDCLAF